MKSDIEEIADEKGKHIAKLIVEKYSRDLTIKNETFFASFLDGLLDGGLSRSKVESEIYERSLHEATSFFLNHGDAKFDEEILKILEFRLKVRLNRPKDVRKMIPEEMLAMVIAIDVTDYLLHEHDIVI
jgi:hypothetical protein